MIYAVLSYPETSHEGRISGKLCDEIQTCPHAASAVPDAGSTDDARCPPAVVPAGAGDRLGAVRDGLRHPLQRGRSAGLADPPDGRTAFAQATAQPERRTRGRAVDA